MSHRMTVKMSLARVFLAALAIYSGSATAVTYDRLAIRLVHEMGDGRKVESLVLAEPISALAGKPLAVSLLVAPTPAPKQGANQGGGMLGGFGGFGSMGGGENSEPVAKADGLQIQAWFIRDGKLSKTSAPQQSACDKPQTCVRQTRLRFELSGGGASSRTVERVLVDNRDGKTWSPRFARYAISVLSGSVREEDANRYARTLASRRPPDETGLEREKVAGQHASRDRLLALDEAPIAGHVINLRFAAASDALTRLTATNAGVTLNYATPRILITRFTSDPQGKTEVSLDLRLDEVEAEGGTDNARRLFQHGRGLAESHLEQIVVSRLLRSPAVSTATVMSAAARARVKLLVLDRASAVLPAGMPIAASGLVKTAIAVGHHVVLPSRAVAVGGEARWAWWDIDPATGRTVGVMDSGEHQGLTEYQEILKQVPLNPETGFVLGLMIGANYTVMTLSAAILEAGELTDDALVQIQKSLEEMVCILCPPAQAEVKSEVKVGGDCMKKGVDAGHKFEFCDRYADGFKCAVGMLINAARGKQWGTEIERGGEAKFFCANIELKKSTSSGDF